MVGKHKTSRASEPNRMVFCVYFETFVVVFDIITSRTGQDNLNEIPQNRRQ